MKPLLRCTDRPSRRSLSPPWQSLILLAAWMLGMSQAATGSEFKLVQPTPGGIDPSPVITNVSGTDSLLIQWIGLTPPYRLQRKSGLTGGIWENVGNETSGTSATAPRQGDFGIFRVQGQLAGYVGSDTCQECHDVAPSKTHSGWMQTPHAKAFQTLKKIGQEKNASCLPCHVVGFGTGGFKNEIDSAYLAGVQCENCHGPAADHVTWASGDQGDPKILPITTPSAMLCGGCHNGFHHPTYDEWKTAGHAEVNEDVAHYFLDANRTNAVTRMNSCGACHSGAVRFQMLSAYNLNTGTSRTNVIWPTGLEAAETAVTCVTCHETHAAKVHTNVLTGLVYTNQLRHPLTSTNVFSYNTSKPFADNYNPSVSMCGQCHNARGASVSSSSRPPHHSVQYNMMLGVIGVADAVKPTQGAHRNNEKQCVGCHTHGHNADGATPSNPAYTGHGFRWTVEACQECHKSPTGPMSATNLLASVQTEIRGMIAQTKTLLDTWATTKNTNSWATLYGALGWEYTTPGQLSNPTGSTAIKGPTATQQEQIPQGIKDARFNLYLVEHDGSHGIHNAPYMRYLLEVAQRKMNAELAK